MHPLLTRLGVPDDIQDFFKIGELNFYYGPSMSAEVYSDGFHFVPAADEAWIWAPAGGSHVVVTHSVMEAIAFLSCNRHRYADLQNIAVVALGRRPLTKQLAAINARFSNRKFILVFANDLPGRLTDVFVAAGLRNHSLRIIALGDQVEIIYKGRSMLFSSETVTLNVFFKVFSIRMLCRTIKPKLHASFLTQMLQGTPGLNGK